MIQWIKQTQLNQISVIFEELQSARYITAHGREPHRNRAGLTHTGVSVTVHMRLNYVSAL